MALQQAVGASIGVSATLPATHDALGFGALTFIKLGRINGYPDLDGTYDIAAFTDMETGEEIKFVDVLRAGSSTFDVGLDMEDAGQTAVQTAFDGGDKMAFEFTLKSGAKYYRTAAVTSFAPSSIATGNVVMASLTLEFEKTTVKVAA